MKEVTLEEIRKMLSQVMGNYIVYQVDREMSISPVLYTEGIPGMLGFSEGEFQTYVQEMTQSSFWGFDPETVKQKLKEHIEKGGVTSHTSQLEHRTKGYVWIYSRSMLLGTMQEKWIIVTELINVDEAAGTVGMLTEQSNNVVYVIDAENRKLLYVNEKYLEWAKTTRKEALAHHCYEVCIHSEKTGYPCKKCAPLQAFLQGGTKECVEQDGQVYYHITTQEVKWGGRKAYAITLLDISEKKLAEKARLKQYYRHINTAVATISNSYLIGSVNLTHNTVRLVHRNGGEQQVPYENGYDCMLEWLAGHVSLDSDRRKMLETLERSGLLEKFKEGYLNFSVETIYSREREDDTLFRITLYLSQNPISGDVEGTLQMEDISVKYAREQLADYLVQNAYDSTAILDMKYSVFSLIQGENGTKGSIEKSVPYEPMVRQVSEKRILEEERNQFEKNCSIQNIREKLLLQDVYSFLAHSREADGNITYERFSFAYLNKYRQTVIATTQDMTKDFEIDELTGLYKYNGFCIRAAEKIRNDTKKNYALLYFNIKGFKAVNELFGNEAGDKVLQEMTKQLANSGLKAELMGRLAVTDHFLCLVEEKNVIFNEIKNLCHFHMILDDKKISIHGRCGIYMVHDRSMSVERMCDQAKLAKQHIRDDFVKPYAVFDEKMKEAYLSKTNAVSVVNQALENGEFCVFYQPIYDAATGELASAEALVRWRKPGVGLVSPGLFVPALEENGYISLVDRFVARTVREFQQTRLQNGEQTVPISVNLSWIDFYDETMMNSVMQDIAVMDKENHLLRYEVTETSWAAMNSKSSTALRKMREQGVKILLDDFGSGFSSFSTIRDYDFDILKIDMGFVQKLGMDEKADGIICAIIEMAHHMHASVVAEGVETDSQRKFLAENGCDYLQGYYFSKPIPEEAFIELLREQKKGDKQP